MNIKELAEAVPYRVTNYLKIVAIVLIPLLLIAVTSGMLKKKERFVSLKREELSSFYKMKAEYLKEKQSIAPLERRALMPVAEKSVGSLIESMSRKVGIGDKIVSIKPLEEREKRGFVESGIEVSMERLNMNQLINLLYRIKNSRNLIIIKEFAMESHFENPDLIDISMQVALIRGQ